MHSSTYGECHGTTYSEPMANRWLSQTQTQTQTQVLVKSSDRPTSVGDRRLWSRSTFHLPKLTREKAILAIASVQAGCRPCTAQSVPQTVEFAADQTDLDQAVDWNAPLICELSNCEAPGEQAVAWLTHQGEPCRRLTGLSCVQRLACWIAEDNQGKHPICERNHRSPIPVPRAAWWRIEPL